MFCISHFILNTHRLWITYFDKTQFAPQILFAKLKNIQKNTNQILPMKVQFQSVDGYWKYV